MEVIEIVVGVLKKGNKILISQRQAHQEYADFWEFPGGKVEKNESFTSALTREFQEEVGVKITEWQSLIQIPWQYAHANVVLNVFVANKFTGRVVGKEGQKIKWIDILEIEKYSFPEANSGIVNALRLPDSYAISGSFEDVDDGLRILKNTLESGIKLVQLRAKKMPEQAFIKFAIPAIELVHEYGAKVLLNAMPEILNKLPNADGLQLSSTVIQDLSERPISEDKLLSVSTHNEVEITKALDLKADVILLSPVKKTSSHPDLDGIGWQKFEQLVKNVPVPVYALGGMQTEDIRDAKKHGGQGVAAISSFWKNS